MKNLVVVFSQKLLGKFSTKFCLMVTSVGSLFKHSSDTYNYEKVDFVPTCTYIGSCIQIKLPIPSLEQRWSIQRV